ncbi:MAG: TolC family protein [Bdellovibrionota bacterium]
MIRFYKYVFIAALMLCAPYAYGTPGETLQEVTLTRVLTSTSNHHPQVQAALAALDGAKGTLLSAQGGFDPTISLNGQWYGSGYYDGSRAFSSELSIPLETASSNLFVGGRNSRGEFPIYEDQYKTLRDGEVGAGIRLSLLRGNLIDRRRTDLAVGELQLEQQEQELQAVELFLQQEAALAFWEWSVRKHQIRVFQELLEVSERRQSQFEEQVKLGQLARIEALDNSRTILNRREKLLEQEQTFQQAAQKLSLFLRDESGDPVYASEDMKSVLPQPLKVIPEYRAKLEKAIKERPDIKALTTQLETLERERSLLENNLLPALDLETAVTRDYGEGDASREGTEWKGMLTFEVPLYRRTAKGKLGEVNARIRETRQELRLIRDRLRALSRSLLEILERSYSQYQVLKDDVSITKELEEGEFEKFQAGASNLMLVAMRELTTAGVRQQKLDSLLTNRAAFLQLVALVGEQESFGKQ